MMSQSHLSITLSVKFDEIPLKHDYKDTAHRHLQNLWGMSEGRSKNILIAVVICDWLMKIQQQC